MQRPSLTIKKFDSRLFWLTLALTIIGTVIVADVSSPQALRFFKDPFFFAKQHAVWGTMGLASLGVVSFIDYKFWERTASLWFVLSIILLVLVLIPGVGVNVLGARRWISLGPVSFQPSEFAKFGITIFFAKLASSNYKISYYLGALVLVTGLIMLQPDLGTTISITFIAFTQLFVTGIPLVLLFGLTSAGAALAGLLVISSAYRKQRLVTFIGNALNPLGESAVDAGGSAYHIRQILIALGSGGLFGVGIGKSRQKHLFLPETATDSVFAIIAEEIGFLGATLIIIVLTVYIFQIIKVAKRAPDTFSAVFTAGVAGWLGGQMFLNLASNVALTPITGIPLPFMSYGGSSLTMILFSIGIVLNISKHEKKK